MADFVAVLRKTIDGLGNNTPELRGKVYDKARSTIAAKLAAINPPPPAAVAERQKQALEDAIAVVEAGYAEPVPEKDPADDELDEIFTRFERNEPLAPTPPRIVPAAPLMDEPEAAGQKEEQPSDERDLSDPAAGLVEAPPLRRPEPSLAGSPSHEERRKPAVGRIMAALLALAIVGGGAYGIWLNRAEFAGMLGLEETVAETAAPAGQETASEPEQPAAQPDAAASAGQAAPEGAAPSADGDGEDVAKFTQRLTPEGEEVDEGPAGGRPSIGEGTSVAAATQSAPAGGASSPASGTAQPAADGAPAEQPAALPVGQRAIFYEERTNLTEGSADPGSIVWSLVQESPGADLPPEPAIRAEVTVPSKEIQLRMTIRRNADSTLPASHIIEMIFLTPGNFEGGAISNVLRIALKDSEEAPGSPLLGIPAKIADGYFLVALSDRQAERDTNLQLLQRQRWIDIPIVYTSGRRALVTMEKGIPGDEVFNQALEAWRNAPQPGASQPAAGQ